jgi:hypothetical protein
LKRKRKEGKQVKVTDPWLGWESKVVRSIYFCKSPLEREAMADSASEQNGKATEENRKQGQNKTNWT